jgi:hypothetical protein
MDMSDLMRGAELIDVDPTIGAPSSENPGEADAVAEAEPEGPGAGADRAFLAKAVRASLREPAKEEEIEAALRAACETLMADAGKVSADEYGARLAELRVTRIRAAFNAERRGLFGGPLESELAFQAMLRPAGGKVIWQNYSPEECRSISRQACAPLDRVMKQAREDSLAFWRKNHAARAALRALYYWQQMMHDTQGRYSSDVSSVPPQFFQRAPLPAEYRLEVGTGAGGSRWMALAVPKKRGLHYMAMDMTGAIYRCFRPIRLNAACKIPRFARQSDLSVAKEQAAVAEEAAAARRRRAQRRR